MPAKSAIASARGQECDSSRFLPCGRIIGLPWYCVRTDPKAETLALRSISKLGHAPWLPQIEIVWANRQRHVSPLFPRYLFVQLDLARDDWMRIHRGTKGTWSAVHSGTRGVSSLMVSASNRPIAVPDVVMAKLWDECDPDGIVRASRSKPAHRIEVGDTVRVMEGPFATMQGLCQMSARDRVWLLLGTLKVEMLASDVEVV